MPFHLTLTTPDGATTFPVTCPTSWGEVSLATAVALLTNAQDERSAAELLCGLPAGALDQLALQDVAYLANALAFASDYAPLLELVPTPDLPDIGSQPYGTLLLAQQYMAEQPDLPALAYGPRLLALYRMQLLWGKYDEAKVAACEASLLAAPVTETYADCGFFLSSYRAWQSGTLPTPTTRTSRTMTKPKPTATHRSASGLGLC